MNTSVFKPRPIGPPDGKQWRKSAQIRSQGPYISKWHILFGCAIFCCVWCASKSFFDSHDSAAAFLACRWHELFDEYTPDTFHPKLFSLPSLVNEAIEIGELHADHESWGKHLKKVQEEIGERLERGLERNLCSPRHLGMLRRIQKSTSAAEVVGLGRVLALEHFSTGVEKEVIAKFRDLSSSEVPRSKTDTDVSLTALATHAFQRGCSAVDCQDFQPDLANGFESVRSWILSCLPETIQEFDCIIAVKAGDTSTQSQLRAVCDHPNISRVSPRTVGIAPNSGIICFRRNASGLRERDAIDAIKADVRAGLNLLALYNQKEAPQIMPGGWAIGAEGAKFISESNASFRNLHPRRDAVKLAERAAAALVGRNEPAIRAALDLHNLALSMTDQRLRLVNLWSALECLASVVEGDSIISRVERLVVPILTWRKIDKVVRYLAISIHFWLRDNPALDRESLPFGLGHNDSVAPEQILTLLTEPENSSGIKSLLNLVSGHPLLLYRIHRAWDVFHDPKSLRSNLNQSERRLGWHLWRIYRARNLLVHQGIEPPCLPQLANHLQQYFSWTLSRLIHGITHGSAWTTKDSWHYWKSRSDHVTDSLEKQPAVLKVGDMFPEELLLPEFPVWRNQEEHSPK